MYTARAALALSRDLITSLKDIGTITRGMMKIAIKVTKYRYWNMEMEIPIVDAVSIQHLELLPMAAERDASSGAYLHHCM